MSATHHTPGPWAVEISGKVHDPGFVNGSLAVFAEAEHQQQCALAGNAACICVIAPPHRITEEDFKNAKLIASAPAMLAALKTLCDIHDDDLSFAFAEWQAARDAIKAATE
jgi:hypothetical protein